MSDILKAWLAEEVGLQLYNVEQVCWNVCCTLVEGRELTASIASCVCCCSTWHARPRTQDFASGFAFGKVMQTYGMQPDFDKFEMKRSPDAMVNNYTRLQVRPMPPHCATSLLRSRLSCIARYVVARLQASFQKLGVKFDSRTANALMREEPGVALRLLYSLKQSLSQVHKDVQVCDARTPALIWMCKRRGRGGLGTCGLCMRKAGRTCKGGGGANAWAPGTDA
eukprot:359155-Chlamydomonas_euryale.AAC.2